MATEAHVRGASALDALAGRLTQNILYVWGPNEQVAASAASAELDGQPEVGAREALAYLAAAREALA